MKIKILIVDDERDVIDQIAEMFHSEAYDVIAFENPEEALVTIKTVQVDIIIMDLRMHRINGIDLLKECKKYQDSFKAILLTAFSSESTLEKGINEKLFNKIVRKSFDPKFLKDTVDDLFIELTQERSEKDYFGKLREHISYLMQKGHELIYESSKMKSIHEMSLRYANSNANVLIEGESGVGKEVIATIIHNNSKRKDKPFIKINVSSIPDNLFESELFGHKRGAFTGANSDKIGKFQLADGGTLFLDEIGDMPISQQAKLLRAIENQEISPVGGIHTEKVNLRIICATNKKLDQECKQGNFRNDLLYRLNIVSLNIPPLRERKDDIPLLIAYFLSEISKTEGIEKNITQDAVKYLSEMSYPGNVRELKNILYRVYLMSDTTIDVSQIKKREHSCGDVECDVFEMKLTLDEVEKKYLEHLAGRYKCINEIAKVLKMDRSNLRKKLKNLGIDLTSFNDN